MRLALSGVSPQIFRSSRVQTLRAIYMLISARSHLQRLRSKPMIHRSCLRAYDAQPCQMEGNSLLAMKEPSREDEILHVKDMLCSCLAFQRLRSNVLT